MHILYINKFKVKTTILNTKYSTCLKNNVSVIPHAYIKLLQSYWLKSARDHASDILKVIVTVLPPISKHRP